MVFSLPNKLHEPITINSRRKVCGGCGGGVKGNNLLSQDWGQPKPGYIGFKLYKNQN